jgi:hypothetical protein
MLSEKLIADSQIIHNNYQRNFMKYKRLT